jgi:phenylalanyl-tRNA synthetase alpha chain
MMLDKIEELASKASTELNQVANLAQLEEWRVRYLGRKSTLVQVLRSLSTLPLEERRIVGARTNEIKSMIEANAKEKKKALERSIAAGRHGGLDVTLPGKQIPIGRLHPTTQTMNEICDIFKSMGFQIVEGPEVEWEYYNFNALNMPEGHPARDMFATLWVNKPVEDDNQSMLLRTHTSPVQIRVMEKMPPPIRMIAPGRVYRYEATDATHEWMFYQVEGLAIDKGITFADLKGTLFEFVYRLFGRNRKIRFRCDYFPFVEPGGELAIDCLVCGGSGCRACGNTGWLELLGCGIVHPQVLRYGNINPEEYSGFAFGMGVERILMLRYGIDDIRYFYNNDLRFLSQF